jgi:hypothetical protein
VLTDDNPGILAFFNDGLSRFQDIESVSGGANNGPGPGTIQPIPAFSAPASSQARAQDTNSLDATAAPEILAESSRMQCGVFAACAVLLLGACGFMLSRRQRLPANSTTTAVQGPELPAQPSASLAEALKDELFQLEIDRLHGTVSGEAYDSAREASRRNS